MMLIHSLAAQHRGACSFGMLLLVMFCAAGPGVAQPVVPQPTQTGAGDLNLSPKRVVFDAAGHAQTVYVFNRGAGPATYRIELVDRVMTPDGRIAAIDSNMKKDAAAAARVKSAKDFIIYSPRRVTLQPGESQTIRLRALKPADLADGEYRTHLTVTQVPPEDVGLTAAEAGSPLGPGQLSVHVVPLFSLSIPIIVRQGAVDVRAGIESPRLEHPGRSGDVAITLDLTRLGLDSAYGDFEVKEGDDLLGTVRGVAVYPEIERRTVEIRLSRTPKPGAGLTISFTDADSKPGTVLAKADFVVP